MVALTYMQIKERVVGYLQTVANARNRDIAAAINVPKPLVDRVLDDLAQEEKVEFLCLGASDESVRMYATLKGATQQGAAL